jgi:hypothetical protein
MLRHAKIPDEPTVSFIQAWLKPDHARFGPAVADIPAVLKDDYTLKGKVELSTFFLDQAYLGGNALVTEWTNEV